MNKIAYLTYWGRTPHIVEEDLMVIPLPKLARENVSKYNLKN